MKPVFCITRDHAPTTFEIQKTVPNDGNDTGNSQKAVAPYGWPSAG